MVNLDVSPLSVGVPGRPELLVNAHPDRVLVGSYNATPKNESEPPGIVVSENLTEDYLRQQENVANFQHLEMNKLIDEAKGTVRLINLCNQQKVDRMFFLDKSARPVGYLFLKTWGYVFPDRPPPHISFIEIGRFGRSMDSVKLISEDIKNELTHRYTDLKGQTVCVVDEYVSSGNTLINASKVFKEVFSHMKKVYFTAAFSECPGWHDKPISIGVGEYYRDEAGPYFLSRHLGQVTEESKILRHELDIFAKIIARHVQKTLLDMTDAAPFIPKSAYAINQLLKTINAM